MVGPFPYLTVVILPNFDGQDFDSKDVLFILIIYKFIFVLGANDPAPYEKQFMCARLQMYATAGLPHA